MKEQRMDPQDLEPEEFLVFLPGIQNYFGPIDRRIPMTYEDANCVVEQHIKWLRDNDRNTIADAFLWLFFYMGKYNCTKADQGLKEKHDAETNEID